MKCRWSWFESSWITKTDIKYTPRGGFWWIPDVGSPVARCHQDTTRQPLRVALGLPDFVYIENPQPFSRTWFPKPLLPAREGSSAVCSYELLCCDDHNTRTKRHASWRQISTKTQTQQPRFLTSKKLVGRLRNVPPLYTKKNHVVETLSYALFVCGAWVYRPYA